MPELDYVITNGYCDIDTIEARRKNGWDFVITVPATLITSHALPTDKATIFSKAPEHVLKSKRDDSSENANCCRGE